MKKSTVYIILLHLVYWSYIFYRLYTSYVPEGNVNYQKFYVNNIISIGLGFITFYIIYSFVFPYFIQKNKAATPITSIMLLFIILLFLVGLPCLQVYFDKYKQGKYSLNMPNVLFILFSFSITALLAKGFTTWIQEIKYKEQLEKSNLESNLALLKARINPHFLFNTLNNIDILIEKDATTASIYLKKLSDILRFTLYESPSETIPLSKEAYYIKQYLELQQIRTNNVDFAKFTFTAAIDDIQIAPMLFIPFIENAFKYSTNKKITDAIVIRLNADGNKITFSCSNAYEPNTKLQYEASSGLGLELIKSRLELLFPNNYELNIIKTADRFNVNLTLTLHDNKLPDHRG